MTQIVTEHNDNLSFLPDAGEGRWWRIVPNPKSQSKPLALQLMESYTPGRKAMSKVLNAEPTIAKQIALTDAAEQILIRIADYKRFLGDYGLASVT